jgi:hypothetical protein
VTIGALPAARKLRRRRRRQNRERFSFLARLRFLFEVTAKGQNGTYSSFLKHALGRPREVSVHRVDSPGDLAERVDGSGVECRD